jgi:predicted DNA-binding transcriptional regulator AlpA
MSDELKVYTKKETQKLLGLSGRTWDREEAHGRTPPKTRLSPNRIGYRASDIEAWLKGRREADDSWQPIGEAAAVVAKAARR